MTNYVKIIGTGTHNAGAELMAHAISQEVSSWKGYKCAVDTRFGSFERRASAGLHSIIGQWRLPAKTTILARFAPESFLQQYGLAPYDKIHAVLDASGFAYGDPWPHESCVMLLRRAQQCHRDNKKHILLPQSLGPFDSVDHRETFKQACELVDLVVPRDPDSLEWCKELDLQCEYFESPDFTECVSGKIHHPIAQPGLPWFLIVPNKMMELHGAQDQRDAYLDFLIRAANVAREKGFQVKALAHSKGDRKLCESVATEVHCEIIDLEDPIATKGCIGQASVVLGSRYHALVSALSQGIPAIATSWAEKYKSLYRDFGCSQLLLTSDTETNAIAALLDTIREDTEMPARLLKVTEDYAGKSEKMWGRVKEIVQGS